MEHLRKIDKGLNFRDQDWPFTNTLLPTGYEISSEDAFYIEIGGNVIRFYASDTDLDGVAYPDSTSIIAAMEIPVFPPSEDAGV